MGFGRSVLMVTKVLVRAMHGEVLNWLGSNAALRFQVSGGDDRLREWDLTKWVLGYRVNPRSDAAIGDHRFDPGPVPLEEGEAVGGRLVALFQFNLGEAAG